MKKYIISAVFIIISLSAFAQQNRVVFAGGSSALGDSAIYKLLPLFNVVVNTNNNTLTFQTDTTSENSFTFNIVSETQSADNGKWFRAIRLEEPSDTFAIYAEDGNWTISSDASIIINTPNLVLPNGSIGANELASDAIDLGYTASPTEGIVTNDKGDDATIPLGDDTNAGLASPGVNSAKWTSSGANILRNSNVGVGVDPSTLGRLVIRGAGTGSGLGLKITDSGANDILRTRDDRIVQFGSSSYSRLIEIYTQPALSDLFIFGAGGNSLRLSHATSIILERGGADIFSTRGSVGPGVNLGNFSLSSISVPTSAATQVGSAYGSWSGRLWNGSAAPYANFNFRFTPSASINNYAQFLLDYNTDTTPGDQSGRYGGNGIITNLWYVDNNGNAKLFGTGGLTLPKGTTAQRSFAQRESGTISYDTDRSELSLAVSTSDNVTFQNYKAGSTTAVTDLSGQLVIAHGVTSFTPDWGEVNIVGSNGFFAKPVSVDGTNLVVEVRDGTVLGSTPLASTSVTIWWKVVKL